MYPLDAQQENRSGSSVIIFTITKDGDVSQTRLHNSSGYKDLDNAAENFCKNLTFIPAKEHGEAIPSCMRWEVKFDLKDLGRAIKSEIADINDLYVEAEKATGASKLLIEKEILKKHRDILSKVKDGIKLNDYIYGVVQNNIKSEWKDVSDSYPLTFLLFHDFISRFKDYDSLSTIKSLLEYFLKQDIDYLNLQDNFQEKDKASMATLIQKIKSFVEINYPQIKLNDLVINLNNNSIS
ncbi:MAG: energy transducer TonB [Ignavibacteriales bacterium]|nr:energy transducer TonB [Ignavibacteriales bacterium]